MKRIIAAGLLFISIDCLSQQADTSSALKVYTLGEVRVSAMTGVTSVNSAEIQKYNTKDVSHSLRILPSFILGSSGSRNESTIYLRGFDIRSVPVFIDGIPVYVSYDGYVDLARFTTFDIAKIDVSKGYSSISYGPNAIGGVINLVSMKPSQKLEISARAGVMSGKGSETGINIGSNLGKFYIQSGFSFLNREYVNLSAGFDTVPLQKDRRLDNSYQKDMKGSIKLGYIPREGNEYSLNLMFSHGSKGNPVYLGNDNLTRKRYWRWPYWDKESVYYISRTKLGTSSVLKIRAYFDRFRNKLSNYDDATYTTQQKVGFAGTYYNDYTLGGNVEFKSSLNAENNLLISVHLKNDNHSEHNNNEPVRHLSDNTLSAGAENVFKPTPRLSLIPGISINLRKSLRAEMFDASYNTITGYPPNSNSVFNAQLSAGYIISGKSDVTFNIAWKSRFATMKDRYSYRLGTVIPNPDLKSETAINMELGSTIKAGSILEFRPELFMSILGNTIQLVSHVQDDLSQVRNTGRSVFRGLDLSAKCRPAGFIEIYAAYSFILQRNLSNPDILFTGVPGNKLFSSVEFIAGKKLRMNVFSEYNSLRYTSSDGIRVSPGYFLLHTRAAYSFARNFTAEAGINNITDRNYTIEEGYPEAGRNFYIALSFDMAKPENRY